MGGIRGLRERWKGTEVEVDRELVEAAQGGDRWALEELVRRTHRSVYTCALRLVGNPDDAADVTQDVYLRVVRKLGGFRHEASFSTWLNRVTTNVAMSTLKRRTRRFAVEGAAVPADTRDPAPEPSEQEKPGSEARGRSFVEASRRHSHRNRIRRIDWYSRQSGDSA